MSRVIIGGAGLAGLACALKLTEAGRDVTVLESAPHAGGRCRSFHDKTVGCVIDNGNHLLLSGNWAALDYLASVGANDRLSGPEHAAFPFLDLGTGERWTVRPSPGVIPTWIFDRSRRVAGTRIGEYFSILRLLLRRRGRTLAEAITTRGPLYDRFWDPFVVSVLNTPARQSAAELITPVLWETFARGSRACRPLIARDSLSDSFVAPAVGELVRRGAEIQFGQRVSDVSTIEEHAAAITAGGEVVPLAAEDNLVLAVPAPVAGDLLPELEVPQTFSPIVNLHFRLDQPQEVLQDNHFMGLVGGTAQWLFLRGDIASVTISAAQELVDLPKMEIIERVWRDVAAALNLEDAPIPACQVIKERRATFLQTPLEVARRPSPNTQWRNLFLAGDWTDTGVPATIEGAIRSGYAAAHHVLMRTN